MRPTSLVRPSPRVSCHPDQLSLLTDLQPAYNETTSNNRVTYTEMEFLIQHHAHTSVFFRYCKASSAMFSFQHSRVNMTTQNTESLST